jgi:elongation factor P
MITANKLKSGSIIQVNDGPYIVEGVTKHAPTARGANTIYKIRARNLLSKTKTDLTCRGDDIFPEPSFETRETQYLYQDLNNCVFMDLESFEQYELPSDTLSEELKYITDGLEGISALILEGRVIGIKLPPTVSLELVECDPAIKGASATARTKPATTQTGLIIQVPEYMQQGEIVKIDTEAGKFLGRA